MRRSCAVRRYTIENITAGRLTVRSPWAAVIVLVMGWLLVAPWFSQDAALAQESAAASAEGPTGSQGDDRLEGAFFETRDVNIVNIEVFVNDKKGNPITGLTREDFEVLEDGKPIVIQNFYAVADGKPVVARPASSPEARDRAAQLNLREIPEDQRLHVVVYVDNFNIEPFHRNRVFRQLRAFLHTLGRQDRVMLVSYDRSLNIRQRFTEDQSLVTSALFELEGLTGGRLQANRERRDLLKKIDQSEDATAVLARTRQHASSIMNDLRFTLDALRDTITSVAGLPGRKAVVYVSDGLPMSPGRDLFFHIQRKFEDMSAILESQQLNAVREFQVLANHANASGVTFHTIDASGLQGLTAGDAENSRASSVDGGAAYANDMHQDNLQDSIQYIAHRTGGTSIVNVNDIGPLLSRVGADFKTYYSLGYSPARAGDGRYHEVEVKVARKGVTVRHRDGYRDKPVSQRMSERTASSLRHGVQTNPLEIGVSIGAMSRYDAQNVVVPFLVQIPLGKIVLVPRESSYEGRLRVYFTAMDEEGAVADVQQDEILIQIPRQDYDNARTKHYTYEARLLMRPGRHIFGAGVHDELGAAASFISAGVSASSG